MSRSQQLPLYSKELRHELDTCRNPPCRNSRLEGKISKCKGCEVMHYCSKQCQEAHWPAHRAECRIVQGQKHSLAFASVASSPTVLTPTQLSEELRAFMHQFGPVLLVSAVNWFRPSPIDPVIRGWQEDGLLLNVSRRPNVPDRVPLWARFRVNDIGLMSFEDLDAVLQEGGPLFSGPGQNFVKQRKDNIKEAKRRGVGNGIFHTWVCCEAQGVGMIQSFFPQFFSPATATSGYLPSGLSPESYFKDGVKVFSDAAFKYRWK